jgi:hypothetical protein
VLLAPLGSLAVGATNGVQVVLQIITNEISGHYCPGIERGDYQKV